MVQDLATQAMTTAVSRMTDDRWLRIAAIVFTVAVVAHNGDHWRRGGDSVTAQVFWVGSVAIVVEVAVVLLVFLRHPSAALAAVAAGFGLAAGYILVHFTPNRGWLSDSLTGGDASWVTVLAALIETVAALGLGIAGLQSLREAGIASAAPGHAPISLTRGVTHPVVAAMIIGNIVIFAGSAATRW
ncbi:MAG: hypothetical protein ACRD0R_02360 [Acidimicrobiales bacterium]